MNRIGIGVVSHAHGHVGTYCGVMKGFEDVELVAVWDDNQDRGRLAVSRFGMDFRPSVDELLNDGRIQAVMIGVETNRHAEFVERAAAAGKHILCQKPLATTLEDCDRISAAVKKHGVKFSMAFQMRQDPVNRKIKSLLEEGAVGNVAVVRRRHCINVLLNTDFVNGPSRWHFDPESNIGMFFDDAMHAADWFYWMLGKPVSVMAEIHAVVTDVSPDDNGVAIYRFRNGEIGVLYNSSTAVAGVNTTEIDDDAGTLIQDYGDAPSTGPPRPEDAVPLRLMRKDHAEWTSFQMPIPAGQGERIEAVPRPFVDYVRGLTDETISADEGRVSVEMVLGAYQSSIEGRRVVFPIT